MSNEDTRERLRVTFKEFMDALRTDLQSYLSKDAAFVCKVDVHLGTEDKYKDMIMAYGAILSEIMKEVPSEYFPPEVNLGAKEKE